MNNLNADSLKKLRDWVSVVHHIPGRIRLKFNLNAVAFARQLDVKAYKQDIEAFPALKSYRLNMMAGSLILEYDARALPFQLIEQMFSPDDAVMVNAIEELQHLVINQITEDSL